MHFAAGWFLLCTAKKIMVRVRCSEAVRFILRTLLLIPVQVTDGTNASEEELSVDKQSEKIECLMKMIMSL
jgi:hypothetical protein